MGRNHIFRSQLANRRPPPYLSHGIAKRYLGFFEAASSGKASVRVWACGLVYKYSAQLISCNVERSRLEDGVAVSVSMRRPLSYDASLNIFASLYEYRNESLPFGVGAAQWSPLVVGEVRQALVTNQGQVGWLEPWAQKKNAAPQLALEDADAPAVAAAVLEIQCAHDGDDDTGLMDEPVQVEGVSDEIALAMAEASQDEGDPDAASQHVFDLSDNRLELACDSWYENATKTQAFDIAPIKQKLHTVRK